MKPSELHNIIVKAIQNQFPLLIRGKPGVGKSDIVCQASKAAGIHPDNLHIWHPVVSDPTDAKGLPWVVEGEAEFLPFGHLKAIMETEEPTVVFLDDLGQAPAAVQAAYMQLLLAREINGQKISDQVTFVAATNRKEDKAGVNGLLEPVKSRFKAIVELEVDSGEWCKWAMRNGMPHELIAFNRLRPELLDSFKATKDLINSPSPRTVAALGEWQNAGITNFEVLAGAAGEGYAGEYVSFLEIYRTLPDIDYILLHPQDAPVPDRSKPSELYAIATALAYRADESNFDSILEYTDRMPEEFQTLCIQDAVSKNRDLVYTKTFNSWSVEHA